MHCWCVSPHLALFLEDLDGQHEIIVLYWNPLFTALMLAATITFNGDNYFDTYRLHF